MATYSSFKREEGAGIIDEQVKTADIAGVTVSSDNIQNNAVTTLKIENGSVTSGKLDSTLDLSAKTVIYRSLVDGDFSSGAISGAKLQSGAAQSNIGYTPLNSAGGTMSGNLIVQNGSYVSPSGATTSGIYFSSDGVYLREEGSNKIYFDGSGRPVEADRPVFVASGRGGWRYANSYGGPGGWRELDNMGWNYSVNGGFTTSNNCRVTAPIAGYYYFYCQSYWYNNANNTNGYTHWNISRNSGVGTSTTGRVPHTIYAYGLRNNHAPGIQTSVIFYMNAGQYVSPQPYFGGNQGRHHGDHSYWCGYLIG